MMLLKINSDMIILNSYWYSQGVMTCIKPNSEDDHIVFLITSCRYCKWE